MGKAKNSDLKQKGNKSGNVVQNKIEKNKSKINKKIMNKPIKNEVVKNKKPTVEDNSKQSELVDKPIADDSTIETVVEKINSTINNSTKKNKNKNNKQAANETGVVEDIKVSKPDANGAVSKETDTKNAEELRPEQLSKIEKKKAKKLQQKLNKLSKPVANGAVSKEANAKNAEELSTEKLSIIENRKAKKLQQKLRKVNKPVANGAVSNTADTKNAEELSPEQLAKIEKRKAKKLQQNLKKQLSKEASENNPLENTLSKNEETGEVERKPLQREATIFVGNLPNNTKRVQLQRLFKDFGPVKAISFRTAGGNKIYKHKTRKGAATLNAYVVLKNASSAQKALALNGTEFKNNHLRITSSTAKNATATAQNGEANYDFKRTVFVGNLKYSATENKLREIFSSCGEIDYVRCLQDGENGCKGVAYVCFKKPDAVGLALELKETLLDERPIHVERYSTHKLGAKEKRDAQAKVSTVKGAKKRLNDKQNKSGPTNNDTGDKKMKKNEYRGVKVNSLKKKNKKKVNNEMVQLAKKIAPKAKTDISTSA